MEAGLRHRTTHGLCKAGTEIGGTENILMAIHGCTNPQQTALYNSSEHGRAFSKDVF